MLQAKGINTFADLASAGPEDLQAILEEARLSFMDPETWPEQAALAAAGKTAELKALQQQLEGGKRRRPDHLTMIEGIGPKIESILVAQGITTFSQLAATDVATLQGILKTANLRLADPTTWPEQARLAAAHKMDELRDLQVSLKGGRRA